jgi:hypothetical protein
VCAAVSRAVVGGEGGGVEGETARGSGSDSRRVMKMQIEIGSVQESCYVGEGWE